MNGLNGVSNGHSAVNSDGSVEKLKSSSHHKSSSKSKHRDKDHRDKDRDKHRDHKSSKSSHSHSSSSKYVHYISINQIEYFSRIYNFLFIFNQL